MVSLSFALCLFVEILAGICPPDPEASGCRAQSCPGDMKGHLVTDPLSLMPPDPKVRYRGGMKRTLGPQDTQKASSRAGGPGQSSYLAVSKGDSLQLFSIMWSNLSYFCFPSDFVFQTESHYADQADLELPQAPKTWDYRCVSLCPETPCISKLKCRNLKTQTKGLS